ncbi:MAG TPA: hypothetical protein PLX89_04690 [Verrucomicrobiota bacterium]|nr:hypothetical protein [Verrucomicrobiota bacterium]
MNQADDEQTALRIRNFLVELSTDLAPDFVVIGGWAAYAHGSGQLSLDGDALITYAALGTLRDRFEVTPNHRMKKEQFRGPTGHDIDLYVERMHGLPVAFDEAQACSQVRGGLRVVCPEHLTILKLSAESDRRGTGKGDKDALDLIFLWEKGLADFEKPELLTMALDATRWNQLKAIFSDKRLTELACGGNGWEAKALRARLAERLNQAQKGERP